VKPLDWDDLRVFLAVARAGRFSAASQRLQFDHSTIARRIDRLEQALNTKVFDRSPFGVTLTAQGLAVLTHAERVETRVLEATEEIGHEPLKPSGTVRIATPEAFGSGLIVENLHILRRNYPDIHLELIPSAHPVSLSKREADMIIDLERPPRGQVKARKLFDCRMGLYASSNYVLKHGLPKSAAELANHVFVWYPPDLLVGGKFDLLKEIVPDARMIFRSSSIVAQQHAVVAGCGIGLLHHFSAGSDDQLIPVLPNLSVLRTYWVLFHARQEKVARIRAVISFLEDIVKFDGGAIDVSNAD
jgi:DNA-binding transcriptional LysR family regulator